MKTSNINLLGSHLSDKNITFVAQDLLALDLAEKIAGIFGTPTAFIAEARALLTRFENEIDAKFIGDARLLAEHLKTFEGKETERTFVDVPQTYVLRFPAVVAPVVEVEGRVIAVHETKRNFNFCFVRTRPMVDSFNVYNFSSTKKLCIQGSKRWQGDGQIVELKEIFTLSELKEALKAEKAEAQRARQIWSEIAGRSPEMIKVNSFGRKSLQCDLTVEAKIERARQIWSEIKG